MNHKPYKIPISVLVLIINARQEVLVIRRAMSQKTKNHLRDLQVVQKLSDNDFWQSQGIQPHFTLAGIEFWQSVTGSLDFEGETLYHAAHREIFEELGLVTPTQAISVFSFNNILRQQPKALQNKIYLVDLAQSNSYQIAEIWRHRYAPNITHNHEHAFLLSIPNYLMHHIQLNPNEHDECQWLPWQQAVKLCFSPSNREMLKFVFSNLIAGSSS